MMTVKKNGFTLIEVMIVISILAVLSNMAALILNQTVRTIFFQYLSSTQLAEIQVGVDRLVKELHQIRNSSDIIITTPKIVEWIDINGRWIQYVFENSELKRRESRSKARLEQKSFQPLIGDLQDLSFDFFDCTGQKTIVPHEICWIQVTAIPRYRKILNHRDQRVAGMSLQTLVFLHHF